MTAPGDGRAQRDARFVLRRRALPRSRRGRRPRPRSWSPRAPPSSTSAASRAARAPSRSTRPRSCAGWCPVIEALAAEVRLSIDTVKPAVARAAVAAGATLVNDVSASLARGRGRRAGRRLRRHAPAGRRRAPCRSIPHYDDVVVEVKAFLAERAEPAADAGVEEIWIDPGHRLRQDRGAQPEPAAPPRPAGRPRLPGARRHQPQALPGPPAGRVRRRRPSRSPTDDRLEGSLATATWAMAARGRHDPGPRCPSIRPGSESRGSMSPVAIKGKWAQGIKPRNFHWIIKDQLAVCERPGGYGANHRRVRRQEEIIWIREQDFGCVISLIASPPQPAQLRRARRDLAAPPVRQRRRVGGLPRRALPRDQGAAGQRHQGADARRGARRSHLRHRGRLPAVGRPDRHRPSGHLGDRADHPTPARARRPGAGLRRPPRL